MSTRQLGAVGLVLLGAWIFVLALGDLPYAIWTFTRVPQGLERWGLLLGVGLTAAVGVALSIGATGLSRTFLADELVEVHPRLEDLLPLVFALGGVWLLVENAFHLIRLLLPFLFYEQESGPAPGDLWYDVGTSVLAVLLFVKSRSLADLWLRLNPQAARS